MTVFLFALLIASMAFAIFYFRWLHRPVSHTRALLKTLPVLLLAIYALTIHEPILLAVALAFAALGDLCLAYDGEPAFVAGLTAFFFSHLAYVALFWPLAQPALLLGSAWRYAAAWLFIMTMLMTLFILWRPAGKLAVPVAIYALAAIAMALCVLTVKPISTSIAAGLLVMSNTALAVQTFLVKPDSSTATRLKPFIWTSYFSAQLIFTLATLSLPRF